MFADNRWPAISKPFQIHGKIDLFLLTVFYRPQRSCGKVMFSEACVNNSVHAGIHTPLVRHPLFRHPPKQTPHGQTPPPDGYWNAFLSQLYVGVIDGIHETEKVREHFTA